MHFSIYIKVLLCLLKREKKEKGLFYGKIKFLEFLNWPMKCLDFSTIETYSFNKLLSLVYIPPTVYLI